MIEIKHRFTGEVLYRSDSAPHVKSAVNEAIKGGAVLRFADLHGADLSGDDLRGAVLYGADLYCADLSFAILRGVDLRDAVLRHTVLRHADLRGADLRGAEINWQSHTLLAELILRAAGRNVGRRMVAGLVAISTDWCWPKFLALDFPEKGWALGVLAGYVREGDGTPDVIRKLAASPAQAD